MYPFLALIGTLLAILLRHLCLWQSEIQLSYVTCDSDQTFLTKWHADCSEVDKFVLALMQQM